MKGNPLLVTGSVLVAAWMTTGAAMAQSSGTINPKASGPEGSKGGSQSERTGETGVPLPKGSPQAGTVESGRSGTSSGAAQSSQGQTIHPSPNVSQGGSKSERTGESNVPLPEGSRQSGTVDMGKSGSGTSSSSAIGSQHGSAMSNRGSMGNVKQAQQALKDKGYDPGPVDGVMGSRTKDAIKSFQNASNLEATGTLNAETAEKLGIQGGASRSSSSGSMRSRDNMKSSDTTVGKDTDQPNQTPSKNR